MNLYCLHAITTSEGNFFLDDDKIECFICHAEWGSKEKVPVVIIATDKLPKRRKSGVK